MSKIKSAWEIALEKTKDYQISEEQLRTQENIKQGKILAGKYLSDDQMTLSQIEEKLKSVGKEDCSDMKKALAEVVLSNICLPSDFSYSARFDRLTELACILDKKAQPKMKTLKEYLNRYLQDREKFVEDIQKNLQNAMRENPEQVDSSQFSQIIEENLKSLDGQYKEAIDRIKEDLNGLFQNFIS